MEEQQTSRGAAAEEMHSTYPRHRHPKLTCFHPVASSSSSSNEVLRLDRCTAKGFSTRAAPAHLVVMVNGIVGSAGDWRFAAKQIVKRFPEDVVVQRSRRNYNTLTFDGVDVMGNRLADEVRWVVKLLPGLKRISFVGHSLGGLIARYAIARLYSESEKDSENGKEDQEASGRVAGLEPMNFITFASPHLGSRWHRQVPLFGGTLLLEKLAVQSSWILGRTGRHLFLNDKDSQVPLLLQMANDTTDLKFISALKSFQRQVLYANACSDNIVGWQTSSIRRKIECPKRQQFIKNNIYPHVVHVETPQSECSVQKEVLDQEIADNCEVEILDMEEAIIQGLSKVNWERVDVSFRKSKQRIFAHTTIQVKSKFLNSDGADVVRHMMDNFIL